VGREFARERGESLITPFSSYGVELVDSTGNVDVLYPYRPINKGQTMKRNRQIKFGVFVCQCGCKQNFTAEYITRAPQYLDKKHRLKKLAENKAASRLEKTKELFRRYKARKAALRAAGVKSRRLIEFASVLPNVDYSLVFRDITRHVPEREDDRDAE